MHAAAVLARSASASASARALAAGGPLPWMTPEGVEIQFLELGGLVGVVKKKFLGAYTGPSTPFSPRPPLFRLTGCVWIGTLWLVRWGAAVLFLRPPFSF